MFTVTAVLTLALGIGGTTAIFTLIHAVMLRSLPVADPAQLYRIGDGDDCCVEGGPQDRWGMFSFPLYRAAQGRDAGVRAGGRVSGGRRAAERPARGRGHERAAAAVRVRHRQLLRDARRRRVRRPRASRPTTTSRRRRRSSVLSHHAWQDTYGGDPSVVGSTFVIEGQPVHGRRRRAAGVLRRDAAAESARSLDSARSRSRSSPATARCSASRCPPGCA